ncbi:MAG TPA: LamG-like jellyroll fold domain-containing protein [Candidatus Baltobacteraceae bacterium]|jgi:hypothetical protein|nr:LamG-like jellyroll fold domain-containing protein [Candidatus Baltobacteraceae bacterium]
MKSLALVAIASIGLAALSASGQSGALTHRYSFTVDASDSVGGANGTLNGGATIGGGALTLNGVNGFVSLPPSLVSNYTSITIETWVTDNGSGGWARIFDFGNNTGGAGEQGTGTQYMFLSLPAGTGNLRGAYTIAGNGAEQIMQWPNDGRPAVGHKTHIVWATDGNTSLGTLYADNVLVASNVAMTITPAAIGATENDWIGRSQWTGDAYFDGSFDEFRIYNFALSAAQVQDDFQLGPNAPAPLGIVTASPSSTVNVASTVTFNVATTGMPPLQFQWRRGGFAIPGATARSLVLTNVSTAAAGLYDVIVSNSFGSSNSPLVSLSVVETNQIPAGGMTHRYTFNDGTANDSVGNANGTLVGGATVSNGQLVIPNTTDAAPATDYLQLPAGIITNDAAVTVEAWATIAPNQYTWANLFDFGNQDADGDSEYDIHLCVHSSDNATIAGISDSDNANVDYQYIDLGGGSSLDSRSNMDITTVFDPPAGYIAVYTNGVLAGAISNVTIQMSGVQDVRNIIGADNWPDPGLQGSINEFRIYNFALSPAQIQGDFQQGPNVALPIGIVTVSPSSTVYAGETVTFNVTTTGIPPFQYQWRSNTVNIAGATNSALVLTNVATTASGSYDVVIDSSAGSTNSPPITLTVTPASAPTFATEPTPAALTNYVGGFAAFSAIVAGSPPITLQWQFEGTNIPGATGSQLVLGNLSASDAGSYTLTASNPYGTNVSTAAALTVLPAAPLVPVLTYHYDNSRSAANTNESVLIPSIVNTNNFGLLWSYAVDGYVYTQALYVPNVNIPGLGLHNVIYIGTENDSVYALDADSNTGANGGVLWHTTLGVTPLSNNGEFGNRYGPTYGDIVPEVGITGTPVIDLVTGTIYVDVFTREVGATSTNYYHRIHALNITNGVEQSNSPSVVAATYPGTGVGGNGSVLTFNPEEHNERSALTLAGGILYVGYAGYGDTDPYHGWLFGFSTTNLKMLPDHIFNTTPNATQAAFGAHAGEGGMWMGGNGLCVDASNNLYFESGNGSFSENTNGKDYADSFIKLATTNGLSVADYFTPYNQADDAAADLDVGSAGPLLLPDSAGSAAHPHLIIGASKQGTIYLVDRDNMGHYSTGGSDNQIVQSVIGQIGGTWSSPAYFNNRVYFQASSDVLKVFTINNGVLGTTPASESAAGVGAFNGGPIVSANGTNNGIVWMINSSAYGSSGPGILYAYNATNLAQELYNSSQLSRDNPGGAVKMINPMVANGKVYVGAEYALSVYGYNAFLDTPAISPNGGAFTNSVTVTLSDATPGVAIYYTEDGTVPTTNSTLYSGPFAVTTTLNLEAVAVKSGAVNSGVATASFVNSAALGDGAGLLGEYWANTTSAAFTNIDFAALPTLSRTDAVVNFNWSSAGPAPSVGQTNFTVRWTGSVQPQFSESYTLTTVADEGVLLWVNGQLLINDWTTNSEAVTNGATLALNAQQLYTIEVDYFQSAGNAVAQLFWSSPSTAQAIIPQTQLYTYTNPPPAVELIGPTNGSTFTAAASVSLTADAAAAYNLVSFVNFYTNGVWLGSVSEAPYALTTTGWPAGSYVLTATATDGGGLTSTSAPVSITIAPGSGLAYGLTSNATVGPFLNQNMPGVFNGSIPTLLSETGAYSDTPNRVPAAGLIPYVPNTPLWSDSAVKSRYMAVPNDSGLAAPAQQIGFAPTGAWTFPSGTVFVKNFDLVVNQTNPSVPLRRLETRLLVRNTDGSVYGVTYKWLPDNSDAQLLTGSLTEAVLVTNATGVVTQNWYYPSPADCLTCHTAVSGYVLGVNTRQLNGADTYPATGVTDNQLRTLNRLGLFYPAFDEAGITNFEQLSSVTNLSAPLVQRARSYLDANCAQCHQPGGTGITFDARYATPLTNQNIINAVAAFSLGYDNAKIVSPSDIWRSVLYDRMNTVDSTIKMPPLDRNTIDTNAVAVMAAWINSLGGTPALAPPVLSPASGTFTNEVTLTLLPPNADAALYYTLDGTLPTTNSILYSGPFNLTESAVVTANAFEANFVNSVAVSGMFTIVPPLDSLFAPTVLMDGSFEAQFSATPGQTYILQASTDLVHWTSLITNTPTSTPFTWIDPGAADEPTRFYRVVLP